MFNIICQVDTVDQRVLKQVIYRMILIDATYINISGGKILLEYLIQAIFSKNIQHQFFFIFDNRLVSELLSKIEDQKKVIILGGEKERKRFYISHANHYNTVFCFANVPPPIKLKDKKVIIFFHNALILDNINKNYSLLQKMFFNAKKIYIKFRSCRNYDWIVQTNYMKNLLVNKLKINVNKIKTFPIYEVQKFLGVNHQLKVNDKNYLYVADGVKQKNHDILLKAWEIIFNKHNFPIILHLTIPNHYKTLCEEIIRLSNKGVLIVNHGHCTTEELKLLYRDCNYFLMPSLSESFGLPLIEAASAGCEIIAADLAYVYDVVQPMMTFDPTDPMDLVRCILSINKETKKTNLIVKDEINSLINLLTTND